MKKINMGAVIIMSTLLLFSGCNSLNKTQKGGAVGVVAGGAMGAVVGKAAGNTAMGAIIVAAVGGTALMLKNKPLTNNPITT